MASKKFYSDDDIQLASLSLELLLTAQRKNIVILTPFVTTSLSW